MDESQSLDALATIINDLSERPHDITLHAKHIKLAQSVQGLHSELQTAMEMLPVFLAAGEDVWLYLLDQKQNAVDLDTADGVTELFAWYERAEADYLCTYDLSLEWSILTMLDSNPHTPKTSPISLGQACQVSFWWGNEAT